MVKISSFQDIYDKIPVDEWEIVFIAVQLAMRTLRAQTDLETLCGLPPRQCPNIYWTGKQVVLVKANQQQNKY